MAESLDFSDDILNYLRQHRGKLVGLLDMVDDLTVRVKGYNQTVKIRGILLSNATALIREKKIIRYRRAHMVKRLPRSSQGLVRISELYV